MDRVILLLVGLLCLSLYILLFRCRSRTNLPPGPKPWPIIGNILELGDMPHKSLADLSKIYGPLLTLRLGSVTTVVVSSPETARELFLKHDLAFSSRQVVDAIRALDHDKHSMAWLPVSPKWRNLRKISAIHLLSAHQLDNSQFLRERAVLELSEYIKECCRTGEAVDIGKAAFTTSINLLSKTFFSVNLCSYNSDESRDFNELIRNIIKVIGEPNLADLFPVLAYFDPMRLKQRLEGYLSKLVAIFDRSINEKLSASSDSTLPKDDVLQALLNYYKQDGSDLSLDDVKHLLLDVFIAGGDTTSTTLEWAMAELFRHPSKILKVQDEIQNVVGKNGLIHESDIEKMPYFQAVVKETFRLHPPTPLLLPRKVDIDVDDYCSYKVPKDTQVLVNAWAIGRDPNTWDNPLMFLPERFMEVATDFKGRHFELIPFGAGRRICPGLTLAQRMLQLMLATLIHSFNWKTPNGMEGKEIDMTEKSGITLQKAVPLLAIPLTR